MKIKWNSEQIPKMNVKNNKDVTFLTYPAYEEMNWLVHGFSTRFGGVSRGIYSSMNLSFTRGDEESCVKENYRRISDAMGFDMNSIVTSDQTHTNLWMANKIIFLEAGIPEENISMPNLCTCCNPEFLFSHRASHGKRGNLGAFLGIRS